MVDIYMFKKEDHCLMQKNFRSLSHKNDERILYPYYIATYFENSREDNKCVSFSDVNFLKIHIFKEFIIKRVKEGNH